MITTTVLNKGLGRDLHAEKCVSGDSEKIYDLAVSYCRFLVLRES